MFSDENGKGHRKEVGKKSLDWFLFFGWIYFEDDEEKEAVFASVHLFFYSFVTSHDRTNQEIETMTQWRWLKRGWEESVSPSCSPLPLREIIKKETCRRKIQTEINIRADRSRCSKFSGIQSVT